MTLPILYSLRHCPYAMRARLALLLAEQAVRICEVKLNNKPPELLAASPKGTVPVLVLAQNQVIDQSLDIMLWALQQNDPQNLLRAEDPNALPAMLALINTNDTDFRTKLKNYKCAARYHDPNELTLRQQTEVFIAHLEQRLTAHKYLWGDKPSLVDYAILPNIRQLAKVDRKWYLQAPYPHLRRWLDGHLQSALFSKAMAAAPP